MKIVASIEARVWRDESGSLAAQAPHAQIQYWREILDREADVHLIARCSECQFEGASPIDQRITVNVAPDFARGSRKARGFVSDATGIIDIIDEGRTGMSTPVNDPSHLAIALKNTLSDPTLAADFGSNGRIWVCSRFARRMVETNYANDLETLFALHPGQRPKSSR